MSQELEKKGGVWKSLKEALSKAYNRIFGLETEYSKRLISRILNNSIIWVYLSYVLAFLGKDEIAETLSNTVVTAIIGVVITYCAKSALENLSKHNTWPDKGTSYLGMEAKEPEQELKRELERDC